MNSPRGHAVAIALKSGKVLIAGGNADGDSQQLATAELFDPATGAFKQFGGGQLDRKSTRLNSSHEWISYAVFCLKKKKTKRFHEWPFLIDPGICHGVIRQSHSPRRIHHSLPAM